MFVGFQVGKEPDLFEHAEGEVLRLVDDEQDVPAGGDAFEQEGVQLAQQVGLVVAPGVFTELGEDGSQHLGFVDRGVENQGGVEATVGLEVVEQLAAERGLAAADFADEDDEALFFEDPVFQMLQGLLMSGAQVEKLRVRCDMEGKFRQAVVGLIHRV